METNNFSFKLEKKMDYKSRYLIYKEQGYQLNIYLEMSGDPKYDWVGVDNSFDTWTLPKGEYIQKEKREEILLKLTEWCKTSKVIIHIGPPLDMGKVFSEYKEKGYTVEKLPDGSTRVTPPPRSVWWKLVPIISFLIIIGLFLIIIITSIFSRN